MIRLFSRHQVELALREVLLLEELDVDERIDRQALVDDVLTALDPETRVSITRAGRRAASELTSCGACPTPEACALIGQCAHERGGRSS